MNLPKLFNLNITNRNVLVRADLEYKDRNSPRGLATDAIVNYLKEHQTTKIKLIGHKGIPEMVSWWSNVEVNYDLRADSREMENSTQMAEELSGGWDIYINESFAESHREYTSVNALPKLMKTRLQNSVAVGLRFEKEVEILSKVLENPKRPLVILISGLKEDKLNYIEPFSKLADKILIGGRLPDIIQSTNYHLASANVLVAQLLPDKEDITINSIERFEAEIEKAETIVVAGPVGKYEDEGHRQGTERVFKKIADSKAFKVVCGGDSESAIRRFNLTEKFDWISVGGGAALEFLTKGTLPGIEALKT